MESVLRPLLFAEPLDLLERHRAAGEPTYIVSASLHEIVQYVADDLGFDGAVGSTCEIVDGVFTGVSLQPCYGPYKAEAVRRIAARDGLDLRPRPGTRTPPATSNSSKQSALRSRSTPTASSGRSPDRRHWPILHSRRWSCRDLPERGTRASDCVYARPTWLDRPPLHVGTVLALISSKPLGKAAVTGYALGVVGSRDRLRDGQVVSPRRLSAPSARIFTNPVRASHGSFIAEALD